MNPGEVQTFDLKLEALEYQDLVTDNELWLDTDHDDLRAVIGGTSDVQALSDNFISMRYGPIPEVSTVVSDWSEWEESQLLGEDADGDGLPDAWERELMQRMRDLDDVDPNGDADGDGDGSTNLEEYISGNYAYDDENEFTLDVVGFNKGAAVLEFMAIRGRDYTVYISSNLTDWPPTHFRMPDSSEPTVLYQHYRAEDVRAVRVEVPSLEEEGAPQYFKLLVQ